MGGWIASPGSCSSGLIAAPWIGGGHMRRNGFDAVRVNSRKPAETIPITPSTRARKADGRPRPNNATAPPQIASTRHHSRIDPSWFPQVPVIR